jgi:hypothetical protein
VVLVELAVAVMVTVELPVLQVQTEQPILVAAQAAEEPTLRVAQA